MSSNIIAQLKTIIAQLQATIAQLQATIFQQKDTIKGLQKNCFADLMDFETMIGELKKSNRRGGKYRRKFYFMESKKAGLQKANKYLLKKVSQQKYTLRFLRRRLKNTRFYSTGEDLHDEQKQPYSKIKATDDEISKLQSENKQLKQQLQEANDSLNDASVKNDAYVEENSKLQNELAMAIQDLKFFRVGHFVSFSKKKTKPQVLCGAMKKIRELRKQVLQARIHHANLEKSNTSLSLSYSKSKADLNKVVDELIQTKKSCNDYILKSGELSSQLDEKKGAVVKVENSNKMLLTELYKIDTENVNLKNELEGEKNNLHGVESKVGLLQTRLKQSKKKLQSMEHTLNLKNSSIDLQQEQLKMHQDYIQYLVNQLNVATSDARMKTQVEYWVDEFKGKITDIQKRHAIWATSHHIVQCATKSSNTGSSSSASPSFGPVQASDVTEIATFSGQTLQDSDKEIGDSVFDADDLNLNTLGSPYISDNESDFADVSDVGDLSDFEFA